LFHVGEETDGWTGRQTKVIVDFANAPKYFTFCPQGVFVY